MPVKLAFLAPEQTKRRGDFSIGRMLPYTFNGGIHTASHILWQNIFDTPEHVSYTADNKKEVLINTTQTGGENERIKQGNKKNVGDDLLDGCYFNNPAIILSRVLWTDS